MSVLTIIVEKESDITEALFSFVGCGVLKARVPNAFEMDEVKATLDEYIRNHENVISDDLKKAIKKYRNKWTKQVEAICEEYGIDKDLPLFTTRLKIAKSNHLIGVVGELHGMLTEIRFTFDPISSLMTDEAIDILLRVRILRESLTLIKAVSRDKCIVELHEDEKIITKMSVDKALYEKKYDELFKQYEVAREEMGSEVIKEEYERIVAMTFLNRSI